MKRMEFRQKLEEQTADIRVSAALMQRTVRAAQGKEGSYMKKKVSLAVVFALLAVVICAAALAAANRWGMLDFADRYSTEHYIPEDAMDYVLTDVAAMENEWVHVYIRELYYDGRISRTIVDVTPKEPSTLIMGEDIGMEDPFVNLTNNYIEGGDNDMRPVYQVIQEEGIRQVYSVSVFMNGTIDDVIMGSGDYMLGEDGTLTLYTQEEYMTDIPERDVSISVVVTPFDQPLELDSWANAEKGAVLEMPVKLKASVGQGKETTQKKGTADVYISETGAVYPEAGVRVDGVRVEVKPQELYVIVDYSVIDREKFDALEGGLWFEFIDPDKTGEPWEQRLTEGLTGGGSAGAIDREEEMPTKYRQCGTLGKNELHETYTLRAYDAWEKNRYETREVRMIPEE